MEEDLIKELFCERFGQLPASIRRLAGAGSSRRYYRIVSESGLGVIATAGDDIRENHSFINLSCDFKNVNAISGSIPEIFAVSKDNRLYLQSDFGNRSLFDLITEWKRSKKDEEKYLKLTKELKAMLKLSIDALAELQTTPSKYWEKDVAFEPFSSRLIKWDLNYFKYCFLKPAGIVFDESRLEDDFERFAGNLLRYSKDASGFMYRDFQSRNIMLVSRKSAAKVNINTDSVCSDEYGVKIGLIDFQGGRRGPAVYDIISLLWQAKAEFPAELREVILEYYFEAVDKRGVFDCRKMRRSMSSFVLFRTLQVLGAYGFRGLVEKKAHFLESIGMGLKNLKELIEKDEEFEKYPELMRCCQALCEDKRFKTEPHEGLRIKVFSFSYKKGYPEDLTGNGGGFMFDCRGMHNPGRYEEYKNLTGRDAPVIKFLEKRGEVFGFLNNAYGMVDASVETYLRRGFSELQVGFGCTGGQHRSVYCAEHMAEHLREKFPEAEVMLIHREHP